MHKNSSLSFLNVRTGLVKQLDVISLDTTTPYSDLDIAASQLSGDIKIGNAKTSGSIYLGNTRNTGNSVIINAPLTCGSIEASSIQIDTFSINSLDTTTPYSDLDIAGSQLSGDIKIGNAKTSGSIYLGNTGNTGNSVIINAPLTCGSIEASDIQIDTFAINSLETTAPDTDLSIAGSQLSGDIQIGNAKTSGNIYLGNIGNISNSVIINAPLTCGSVDVGVLTASDIQTDILTINSLDTTASDTDLNIAGSQLSGNIQIGNAKTSGNIYLGNIGNISNSVIINAPLTCGSIDAGVLTASDIQTDILTINSLDTTASDTDLNIAGSQLSGDIKIGNAKTSGSIYLGNTGNTGNSVIINSPLHVNGQTTFDVPPHSITPILGNDVATKDYVDSLVGQYSGGYNLYLNYSEELIVDSIPYKTLSNEVSNAIQQDVLTVTDGTNQLIATFLTDKINILEIPTGLWSLTLYGAVSGEGVLYYYFKIKKKSDGIITDLITSGNSPDINTPTTNPDAYHMSATISTPIDVALTDRIIIEIYCIKISGENVNLNTYFESSNYSFIQTTLNAGTTLLTSSNNWTGNNNFALIPTAPTPTSGDSTTKIATTAFISNALSSYLTSYTASSTYATIASVAGIDTSTFAPLASPTFTGEPLSTTPTSGDSTTKIATTAFISNALSPYLTSSTASSTYATIASPTFTGIPLSTTPTSGDSTTKIATTAFISNALSPYLTASTASSTYATIASPTFTGIPLSTTPTSGDSTTKIATTAFISNALSSYLTAATASSTYATIASPTFTGEPLSTTPTSGDSTTKIATTAFISNALSPYLTASTASSTFAPLASPTFTGIPLSTTPTSGDSTTKIATTAFISNALSPYLTASIASSTYATIASVAGIDTSTFAPLASPTFTGEPLSTTPTSGDSTTKIATTAFISNALSSYLTAATASSTYAPLGECPPIQFVTSTSGDITYTLSLTTTSIGYVWITPNAGGTSNRRVVLPTNPPIGYTIHMRNNTAVSWILAISTAITNGSVYGTGNSLTSFPGSTLTVAINGTQIIRYAGSVTIGTTPRIVWLS